MIENAKDQLIESFLWTTNRATLTQKYPHHRSRVFALYGISAYPYATALTHRLEHGRRQTGKAIFGYVEARKRSVWHFWWA